MTKNRSGWRMRRETMLLAAGGMVAGMVAMASGEPLSGGEKTSADPFGVLPDRSSMLGGIGHDLATIVAWSGFQPEAAAAWVEQLPESIDRPRWIQCIAYEVARTEPARALTLAALLPAGAGRGQLELHALRQWAGTEPTRAWEWVKTAPAGPERQRMVAMVAMAGAGMDPGLATSLVVSELTPGPDQDRAAVVVVRAWASREPGIALAWVQQLADSGLRRAAVGALAEAWAKHDVMEVTSWLEAVSDPDLRRRVLEAHASVHSLVHPVSVSVGD